MQLGDIVRGVDQESRIVFGTVVELEPNCKRA